MFVCCFLTVSIRHAIVKNNTNTRAASRILDQGGGGEMSKLKCRRGKIIRIIAVQMNLPDP